MYPSIVKDIREQVGAPTEKETKILIAEDDDAYYRLLVKNFERYRISNSIIRFSDGQEILNYLFNHKDSIKKQLLGILLVLDINMPRRDGFEVLRDIRHSEKIKDITVIIHSSSGNQETINRCYSLGCDDYIIKTGNTESFLQLLETVKMS